MARDFEKISFEQFKKDVKDDEELYNEYMLPSRGSIQTAGYDFHLIEDVTIGPGEILKVPTGIKSYYNDDEVLLLIDRSSTGFKHNVRLCNQVGVIDADYYNNPDNEGHIFFKIQNHSDKEVTWKKGDSIIQGVFMKYLVTDSDIREDKQRRSDK